MNKKIIIIICIIILFLGTGGFIFFTKNDKETNLNMSETMWIEKNKNNVIDISIYSEMPILSYNGNGIIFDFLDSVEDDLKLTFNKLSYEVGENPKTDYAFIETNKLDKKDILLLTDNYVLVSKTNQKFVSLDEIKNLTIGTLNNDLQNVNTYIKKNTNSYTTYDNIQLLMNALYAEEVNLIAIPKTKCIKSILENKFYVAYNIPEIKNYYVLRLGNNKKFNNILKKYYSKWSSEEYNDSYNLHFVDEYFTFSKIEEQYKTKFRSKEYKYGFVNNSPFDLVVDKSLLGINYKILTSFATASNIKINFKEYSDYSKLIDAFNKSEIDFYLNIYQKDEYLLDILNTISIFDERYVVLSKYNNNILVNSINSLRNDEVSVVKGTKINEYLKNNEVEYKEYKTLDKLVSSNSDVIIIDYNSYDYYKNNKLKKYKINYIDYLDNDYNYTIRGIKDNQVFYDFLNFYLSFSLTDKLINNGISELLEINYLPIILKNVLTILASLLLIAFIVYLIIRFRPKNIRRRKNILTKEEKLKYLDSLTSLKNRDYLNDNMEKWDNREIYPQTIIIIDLNNIAYINDNYGHTEGDNTIKEAANVLIKNQLPNSEIIRTNGNEFLIYLVSYSEKQVITYIRKLNKELKDISHNFGAAIGYSIVNDGIKTIDDAINEATIDMKNNKEEIKN